MVTGWKEDLEVQGDTYVPQDFDHQLRREEEERAEKALLD